MKNIFILLKLTQNKSYGRVLTKSQERIMGAAMLIATIILSSILQFYLYKELKISGLGENIIHIGLFLSVITMISLSIPKIFLNFYYDKNILNMLVFPIKISELILSKLIFLLKIPFSISFVVFFISTLVYGINENMKIGYFLLSFILSIELPIFTILPILIISLLFFNLIGNKIYLNIKNSIYILTLLINIIFIFTIKFFDFSILLKEIDFDKYKTFLYILGGSYFLLDGIINKPSFIILVNSSLILAFEMSLFYIVFKKFYYRTILKISSTNKKIYKSKNINYGILINLILIELKSITRNPFLFTHLIIRMFFIPISILFIFFNKNNLGYFLNLNSDIQEKFLIAIIYLQASLNITSITSISRDKNRYLIEKIFPINIKNKIYCKIITGFTINIIPIFFTILFFQIIFKLKINILLIIILYAIFICFTESINCFIKNTKNVFTDYEKEQDIIYSNYNVIALFIKSIIIFLAIIFGILKLNLQLNLILTVFIMKSLINIIVYKINEDKYINILKNL